MLTLSRDTRFVADELALHHATSQTDIKGLTEATQDLENYLRAKEIYSKARWIDETGQERIRVESNKHGITTLSLTKTKNKSDRYYFREAMRIGKDKIYLSPLDLEVEHNIIKQPHHPILRAATALFGASGKPRGIAILDYETQDLFQRIETVSASSDTDWMLLNQEGYWLHSPDATQEFGFMLPHKTNMSALHPHAWAKISATPNGYFFDAAGDLWLHETIRPYLSIGPDPSPRSQNSA